MKLVPTASQTVGPFFSIGFEPLYQNASGVASSRDRILIRGTVYDGDRRPIPDAVLEFWSAGKFVRVPTADDGTFSASIEIPRSSVAASYLDVLIFMRGLLKPVFTRVYLGEASASKNDSVLNLVPEGRIATLFARKEGSPNQFIWDVVMQGENETVFFEF
jgi:protocatechuate 3,4-dioxygenase alpha subunit